jgi:hypothetical protein
MAEGQPYLLLDLQRRQVQGYSYGRIDIEYNIPQHRLVRASQFIQIPRS